jgi:hypothetical protein
MAVKVVQTRVIDIDMVNAHEPELADDIGFQDVTFLEQVLVGMIGMGDRGGQGHPDFGLFYRKDQHTTLL